MSCLTRCHGNCSSISGALGTTFVFLDPSNRIGAAQDKAALLRLLIMEIENELFASGDRPRVKIDQAQLVGSGNSVQGSTTFLQTTEGWRAGAAAIG